MQINLIVKCNNFMSVSNDKEGVKPKRNEELTVTLKKNSTIMNKHKKCQQHLHICLLLSDRHSDAFTKTN